MTTVEEINISEIWSALMTNLWIVFVSVAVFSLAAVGYSLTATEWYRAEVLLAHADEQLSQGLASQLGGLASIAGVGLERGNTAEPIAIAKSRQFARSMIEELDMMPVLYSDDWDSQGQRWRSDNPDDHPDIRDAVKLFRENILSVREDGKTGLVTLEVEWTDAAVAANWASEFVARLNRKMRLEALEEAEGNVAFLQAELANTGVVSVQQSIGKLLESELQKLMLARGNIEYAFRVIDPAVVPKQRSRPQRVLIVLVATMLGGMVGMFLALVASARKDS